MEKLIETSRIWIYEAGCSMTAAEVQRRTGADYVMNGGLFDLSTHNPYCQLRIGGKTLADDGYRYWGYGFRDGRPVLSDQPSQFDDYLACVCLVREGKAEYMTLAEGLRGARPRSAVGTLPDGRVWIFCDRASLTPEELQQRAMAAGCRDALMLDGGASSGGVFGDTAIEAGRRAHNYLCFRLEPQETAGKYRRGIDVSAWQGEIDWPAVKADGVEFCMVKAMQGTRLAGNFLKNCEGARQAGLTVGIYHFMEADSEAAAREELQALIAAAEQLSFRPFYAALDVESGKLPADKELLTKLVTLEYDGLEAAGLRPLVYTNLSWLRTRLNLGMRRLWLAWYRAPEKIPAASEVPAGTLIMWQFGTQQVSGISGAVDSNLLLREEEAVPEKSLSTAQKVELLWKKIFGR